MHGPVCLRLSQALNDEASLKTQDSRTRTITSTRARTRTRTATTTTTTAKVKQRAAKRSKTDNALSSTSARPGSRSDAWSRSDPRDADAGQARSA